MKKNLTILIFVLSVILAFLLFLNFKKPLVRQKAQIFQEKTEEKSSGPIKIGKSGVEFFALANQASEIIFYEKNNSTIYKSDFLGKTKPISKIPEASKIFFSQNGKEIIAEINSKKIYFNLFDNKRNELDKNIKNLAFSPDGRKIVYHYFDPNTQEGDIAIAYPTEPNFDILFKTRVPDLEIIWPKNEFIVFYLKKDAQNDLFIFDLNKKALKKIVSRVLIDEINWSPGSNNFLISLKNPNNNEIALFLGDTDKIVDTELKIRAKQCVLLKDSFRIICGKDGNIFEYNIKTKETKKLFSTSFNPVNLQISFLEDFLIFIDQNTARLYGLNIK